MNKWLAIGAAMCLCGMAFAADRNSPGDSPSLIRGVPASEVMETADREDYELHQSKIHAWSSTIRIDGNDDTDVNPTAFAGVAPGMTSAGMAQAMRGELPVSDFDRLPAP